MFVRDKAGGYGIQALGGMLVECVHGDFLNVVGFPLNHFCKQLDLIFNSSGLLSSQDILSHSETSKSTRTTLRSHQPNPASTTSPYASGKHDLSDGPCLKQTHDSQNSPSASPVHKVGSLTLWALWNIAIVASVGLLAGEKEWRQ